MTDATGQTGTTGQPCALITDADRVRLITFNRPHVMNAFDTALYAAVADALTEAADDDGIGAVVLTGAGRAFSAGQDLKEMAGLAEAIGGRGAEVHTGAEPVAVSAFPAMVDAMAAYPKPLIAAVNGVGLGIGFTMLAHCDLVYVAAGARVRTPFTELGVAPEAASSYLFPQRMGWQRAAKVLFGSVWVSAEGLVESGLALEVIAPDALLGHTLGIARTIAAMPLASLLATKRLMLDAHAEAITRARGLEDAAFASLLGAAANTAALQAKLGG